MVDDVHQRHHAQPDLDILTYYERKHLEDHRVIRYGTISPVTSGARIRSSVLGIRFSPGKHTLQAG